METHCPVQAACDYGTVKGEGAGYWYVLHLRDGRTLRGPGYTPQNGVVRIHLFDAARAECEPGYTVGGDDNEPPLFVRCADVVSATIEW